MTNENLPLSSLMISNNSSVTDRWTQWTHVLCFVDGIALSIYSKSPSDIVKKTFKSLHVALKGVDDEFIKVIKALEKDPPEIPPVPINLSPIIPWDDDPSIFNGIMEILRSALTEVLTIISKYASPAFQPVIHAIRTLLSSIEDILKVLRNIKM